MMNAPDAPEGGTPHASLSVVRREILEQHAELRARLCGLQHNAARVDVPWARRALETLLLRFAARFGAHIAFEEEELGPYVRAIDAWASAREAAMRAEHRDQCRRVEHVAALLEAPSASDDEFFEAVAELADELLADMVAEERFLDALVVLDGARPAERVIGPHGASLAMT